MGALLPVEHSMADGRTKRTDSAVPRIISSHGLERHKSRGQMQSASQKAITDASASNMLSRGGPHIPKRRPPCSTFATFEHLHLRVAVPFATGTHFTL